MTLGVPSGREWGDGCYPENKASQGWGALVHINQMGMQCNLGVLFPGGTASFVI